MRRSAKRLYMAVTIVVVALQLNAKCGGDRLAGNVVLGWPQTTHENRDICATDRRARRAGEVLAIVSHNCFECDTYPQFVQAAGEKQGVTVLLVRSEHLRADGYDFGDHEFSLAGRNQQLVTSN